MNRLSWRLSRVPSEAASASSTSSLLDRKLTTEKDQSIFETTSPFDFLQEFDTHFLVDDSQSMFGDNWEQARRALLEAARYCTQRLTKGFSVSFLHHNSPNSTSVAGGYAHITYETEVVEIFKHVRTSLESTRPTAQRLEDLLNQHSAQSDDASFKEYESTQFSPRPLKIIVITNGIPSDDIKPILASIEPQEKAQSFSDLSPSLEVNIDIWQVGRNALASHFFYKTGKLRNMPTCSPPKQGPQYKYDCDRPDARPSSNFATFMSENLTQLPSTMGVLGNWDYNSQVGRTKTSRGGRFGLAGQRLR